MKGESLDLTAIPKTRAEVKQQLELAKEKQEIGEEIQKVKSNIRRLEQIIETEEHLEAPSRASMNWKDGIKEYQEILERLDAKLKLLECPMEEPTLAVAAMRM